MSRDPYRWGRLNDFVVQHSTNNFLFHRYIELSRSRTLPEVNPRTLTPNPQPLILNLKPTP